MTKRQTKTDWFPTACCNFIRPHKRLGLCVKVNREESVNIFLSVTHCQHLDNKHKRSQREIGKEKKRERGMKWRGAERGGGDLTVSTFAAFIMQYVYFMTGVLCMCVQKCLLQCQSNKHIKFIQSKLSIFHFLQFGCCFKNIFAVQCSNFITQ